MQTKLKIEFKKEKGKYLRILLQNFGGSKLAM
jgi:hypothetical protein